MAQREDLAFYQLCRGSDGLNFGFAVCSCYILLNPIFSDLESWGHRLVVFVITVITATWGGRYGVVAVVFVIFTGIVVFVFVFILVFTGIVVFVFAVILVFTGIVFVFVFVFVAGQLGFKVWVCYVSTLDGADGAGGGGCIELYIACFDRRQVGISGLGTCIEQRCVVRVARFSTGTVDQHDHQRIEIDVALFQLCLPVGQAFSIGSAAKKGLIGIGEVIRAIGTGKTRLPFRGF